MYTPVNPSFTILKWGLSGSKLYRHVFVMDYEQTNSKNIILCVPIMLSELVENMIYEMQGICNYEQTRNVKDIYFFLSVIHTILREN